MKVATIVPTPYLNTIEGDEYHMCLYREVKTIPEYAEFYKKQKEAGHFVIMDNGAAEGVNPTIEELIKVYPMIEPDEIVLPDVVYDRYETLTRTRDAYIKLSDLDLQDKYRFMAVPQGSNFTEWLDCMREFVVQPNIMTIGISKFVTPRYQIEMGKDANVRRECVDAVLAFAESIGRTIDIHLLGCWENPAEIGEIARAYGDKVRGTDSAIAYVYTRNNVEYKPGTDRPDNNEIDFEHGEEIDLELYAKNRKLWRNYCNGNLELI